MFNFLKFAYSNELCNEYRNDIRACGDDKSRLVSLALRQQSIPYVATMMYNGILSKDYVIEKYGDYLNGHVMNDCDGVHGYTYSWYIGYDYDNDVEIETDVVHISSTIDTVFVVKQCKCPVIYVSNNSIVNIVCDGYNSVKVYLFDNSKVTIEDTDYDTVVTVYKYSDACVVERGKYNLGKTKEFRKELRL